MPSHLNPDAVIECVPNFSEGTDAAKVSQIVAAMNVTACACWTGRWTRRTTGRW